MRRRWSRIALLLTLVLAVAVSVGQSRVTRAEPPGVFLALGDSVAVGVGSSLPRERGYAALVGEQFAAWSDGSIRVRNLARNGETAVSMHDGGQLQAALADIATAAAQGAPVQAITLTVGGNDLQALQNQPDADRQAGIDAYAEALDAILRDLRAAAGTDVPIVLTTLWDPSALRDADLDAGEWVTQINEVMGAAAEQHGATLVDAGAAIGADLAAYTYEPTDIHPTNAGHRVIADLIWQALAIDTLAPEIEVPADVASTRSPLTLTIHATDDVGVVGVAVVDAGAAGDQASDTEIVGPLQTEDDTWVALIDLGDASAGTLNVTVRDAAGNATEQPVSIALEIQAQPTPATDDATETDDASATEMARPEGTGTPTP